MSFGICGGGKMPPLRIWGGGRMPPLRTAGTCGGGFGWRKSSGPTPL